MEFDKHNGETAWGYWLAQFKDSPRLESLVHALGTGLDGVSTANEELWLDRWLDTARGVQLDGIGDIVGQARIVMAGSVQFFGFAGQSNSETFGVGRFRRAAEADMGVATELLDAEYRNVLRWKIAVNRSAGTAADIAAAIDAVFDARGTVIEDLGNAKVRVIVDVPMIASNPIVENREKWITAAAGVDVEFAGFREEIELLAEDGDNLLTEDSDEIMGYYYLKV